MTAKSTKAAAKTAEPKVKAPEVKPEPKAPKNRSWSVDDLPDLSPDEVFGHKLPEKVKVFKHETNKPPYRICLHHTVGGSAVSSIEYWQQHAEAQIEKAKADPKHVPWYKGTRYVIDRGGKVYDIFGSEGFWAYQLGIYSSWISQYSAINYERTTIGIEIASEGPARMKDGKLVFFKGWGDRPVPDGQELWHSPQPFRDYQIFDAYEPAQVAALIMLLEALFRKYPHIPRQMPGDPAKFYGPQKMDTFRGIIGHVHVRAEKSDPYPDPTLWALLQKALKLTTVNL